MEENSKGLFSEWIAAQAVTTGRSHIRDGTVCQDKTFVFSQNHVFSVALADGAGSARLSHFGAETVTKAICTLMCERFDDFYNSPSPRPVSEQVIAFLLDQLKKTAAEKNCEIKDLASTLLAVATQGDRFLILHLGDGVVGYTKNGELKVATAPKNGEFSNMTYFVTSPQAVNVMQIRKGDSHLIDGFVLMSDGTEASLYSKQMKQLAPVLQRLIQRLSETSAEYLEPSLQSSLDEVVSKKTFDDCSLILAARRENAYNELDEKELNLFFHITTRRSGAAKKQRERYLLILDSLDEPGTIHEIAHEVKVKNIRYFKNRWIEPLMKWGYIEQSGPEEYVRLIRKHVPFSETDDSKEGGESEA